MQCSISPAQQVLDPVESGESVAPDTDAIVGGSGK